MCKANEDLRRDLATVNALLLDATRAINDLRKEVADLKDQVANPPLSIHDANLIHQLKTRPWEKR